MKANAPEKLYYAPYGDIREDYPITDNDIEYIRKDAFINKAAGWLSDNTLSGLCLDFGNVEIVREFVDNFRNAMKLWM